MSWKSYRKGFETYLKLEKSLSTHSIEAYLGDVGKLEQFISMDKAGTTPQEITLKDLREFITWINQFAIADTTQARIISGIKAFYKYLLIEEEITISPAELLEGPRLKRKIPTVLHVEEIELMIKAINLSKPEGHRNLAMLETIYSCGLRVSELINLKITNLYLNIDFIKVVGKGDKERLVPIGETAKKNLIMYIEQIRNQGYIDKTSEDFVFISKRGKKLTRVMFFIIVKQLAELAGIKKVISPHTFRHSFATHLIEGGADLRAIQEMLGHESITTTEIYTHIDKDFLRNNILQFHPRK